MSVYQENAKKYNAEAVRLKKISDRISLIRLLIFLLSGTLVIIFLSLHITTPVFIIVPLFILGFGAAINYHNKITFQRQHTGFLQVINEGEVLKGKSKLESFDPGNDFLDPLHPYTSDLDVFGHHSLFQLLNRTTTESGRVMLAKWLSEPAAGEEIRGRQHAIRELIPKVEWRQEFQASGMHFPNKKSDFNKLLAWVQTSFVLYKYRSVYLVASIILSVLSTTCLVLVIKNWGVSGSYLYFLSLIAVLFINYLLIKKVRSAAKDMVVTSQDNINTLKGYSILVRKIEEERFDSEQLSRLQATITQSKYSASGEIKKLTSLLEFAQQKPVKKVPIGGNYLYPLLNSFLLLDVYLIIGTEKWKSKNKAFLETWSAVISEFEALNSLAGFCYSNPSYTFPEITAKKNFLHFEAMGHPLLAAGKRVCNDFHSEGAGDVVMITGSNMGGKSTFLRTVGVNLVLALAGATCCAENARVSHLKLFTSLRTQDNLKEGVSSFYAELERISKMLKLIGTSDNVYFLLDEMFKGTNSEDRHRGGFSLISQLRNLPTSGIIATHDIELAKLAGDRQLVTNYSFNSVINNDSMIFSYKLEPGICTDFNASVLMEKSGIRIIKENSGDSDEVRSVD